MSFALGSGVAQAGPALLGEPPRELVFRLDLPTAGEGQEVDWLLPFRDASIERLGPMRLYTTGRWGRWVQDPRYELSWQPWLSTTIAGPRAVDEPTHSESNSAHWEFDFSDPSSSDDAYVALLQARALAPTGLASPNFDFTGASLATNGFDRLFRLPSVEPVIDWRCRRRPVAVVRFGGESERLELVRCDGAMAPGALDALSLLARPPLVARPEGGLPDEPNPSAWLERREWVDGVRIVHPRLIWALQQLADAFPGRAIYIYSGYRPMAEVNDGSGHRSLHAEGRALDISVLRVSNEKVFEVCRKLRDVGCGFYPHNKFIHLDVRRAHTGQAVWIDASEPGEPSRYVDGWPGVMDSGAFTFGGR